MICTIGCREFLRRRKEYVSSECWNRVRGKVEAIRGWKLESKSLWRKYSGILGMLISVFWFVMLGWISWLNKMPSAQTQVIPPRLLLFVHVNLVASFKAMKAHHSQFVWFRYLFVLFSCYSFVNSLRLIDV